MEGWHGYAKAYIYDVILNFSKVIKLRFFPKEKKKLKKMYTYEEMVGVWGLELTK